MDRLSQRYSECYRRAHREPATLAGRKEQHDEERDSRSSDARTQVRISAEAMSCARNRAHLRYARRRERVPVVSV